jgi:hypothetical protein
MSFIRGKDTPPLIDPDRKDRFGLPFSWSLLGESEAERVARIAGAEQLIKDAIEGAARHFGHDEARRRFSEIAKKPPRGKQANKEITGDLLAHYDRETSGGTLDKAEAPRRIAEALYKDHGRCFGESALAIEKRIRRALENRVEARAEEKKRVAMYQAVVAEHWRRTFRK